MLLLKINDTLIIDQHLFYFDISGVNFFDPLGSHSKIKKKKLQIKKQT